MWLYVCFSIKTHSVKLRLVKLDMLWPTEEYSMLSAGCCLRLLECVLGAARWHIGEDNLQPNGYTTLTDY